MVRKELMVSGVPVQSRVCQVVGKARLLLMAAALTAVSAFPAFAEEVPGASFDVTATLTDAFQGMATTILGTISATLPVVLSVVGAYICINFGIRFFRKFVH